MVELVVTRQISIVDGGRGPAVVYFGCFIFLQDGGRGWHHWFCLGKLCCLAELAGRLRLTYLRRRGRAAIGLDKLGREGGG